MGRKKSVGIDSSHPSALLDLYHGDATPASLPSSSKFSLFSDSNPFRRKFSFPLATGTSSQLLSPRKQLIDGMPQQLSEHQRDKSANDDGSHYRVKVYGSKREKKKRRDTDNHEVNGFSNNEGKYKAEKKRKRRETESSETVDAGLHLEKNHGETEKNVKKEESRNSRHNKKDNGANVDEHHGVTVEKKKKRREAENFEVKGRKDDEVDISLPESKSEKKRKRKEAEDTKMLNEGLHFEHYHVENKKKEKDETGNNPNELLKEEKGHHKRIKPAEAYRSLLPNVEKINLGFKNKANGIKSAMKGEKVVAVAAAGIKRLERETGGSVEKKVVREMKRVKNTGIAKERVSFGLHRDSEAEVLQKLRESSRVQADTVTENSKEEPAEARKESGFQSTEIGKPGKLNTEKLKRTIFVGNLPLHIKSKVLMREFSQYGEVESVRLRSVPLIDTKLPRKAAVITGHVNEARNSVNAYIVFKDDDAAKAALSHNMKEIYERHIRVDRAQAPHNSAEDSSAVQYDPTRSIFIGNLPFETEDEELYQLFSSSENPDLQVEAVRIVRDPQTSIGKGFAFVLFKTKVGAKFALSRGRLHVRERELRLRKINASHSSETHSSSRSALRPASRGFRESGKNLDRRWRKPLQESKEKSLSKSFKPYEGFRSSLKEGKPARWTSSSQSCGQSNKGKSLGQKPRTLDGSTGVARKKKRPAVVARKNPALKKPKQFQRIKV